MRYALTDAEWRLITPILPCKSRGIPRVDDRRIATRYEKRAASFLAFVKLAAIRLWLRVYESTT